MVCCHGDKGVALMPFNPSPCHTHIEAMFCPPPKGLYTQVLEHMALNLRIESKPVLALILMSFNTLLLYLLLIPMKVCTYGLMGVIMCANIH